MITVEMVTAQVTTAADKEKVMEFYNKAMLETEEAIKGLSETQLNFKPSSEAWSIAQCIEHLALGEEMFLQRFPNSLEATTNTSINEETRLDDSEVYAKAASREKKVKTAKALEPTNRWGDTRASMIAFKDYREQLKNFVRTSDKNLRKHSYQRSIGKIDAVQILLSMAGHHARHNAQINEIKEHPEFPTH